jgi:hypothetical protein
MRRLVSITPLSLGVAVVALAIASGVVLAAFIMSQTTSATLSMSTSADFALYLCEPIGGEDASSDPNCPGDDSAADEIIFSTDENAAPGSIRHWDIRMRNVGTSVAWDAFPVTINVSPVDPNEDCTFPPVPATSWNGITILGKRDPNGNYADPLSGAAYDTVNDNHDSGSSAAVPGAGVAATEDTFGSAFGANVDHAHVAPGDYEDVRFRIQFHPNADQKCIGSEWQLNIQWDVGAHQ